VIGQIGSNRQDEQRPHLLVAQQIFKVKALNSNPARAGAMKNTATDLM
jgi:hypothetical protein